MRIINVKFQDEEIQMVESLKWHIKRIAGVVVSDEEAIKLVLAYFAKQYDEIQPKSPHDNQISLEVEQSHTSHEADDYDKVPSAQSSRV